MTGTAMELLAQMRAALERARDALRLHPELQTRLLTRIERDLLPRLSSNTPVLLAGVAGPNNVGKSSLFNSLARDAVSPARAEGGLTKQCLAVAQPALLAGPVRALLERRFELVPIASGVQAPVDEPGPPGRLYVVPREQVAPGLLLMDTPDFDSVFAQNRANAEALLLTVDVVVFVVSRQTYQNAALVAFLRETVGAGRPYVLVYNEATSAETARAHLAKLIADVGRAPAARYFALHQPEVERGAPLRTEPLDAGPPLDLFLSQPTSMAALQARALQAGLADASRELGELSARLEAESREPARLLERLRHELRGAGLRAAQKSVPADVLISALLDELDARSPVHRWLRFPFRALATALTSLGRSARRALAEPESAPSGSPEALTEASLRDGLRKALEALAPEVGAYRGEPEVQKLLEEVFGPAAFARLEGPLALEPLRRPEQDRAALAEFCRRLVREELPGGAEEGALQALATLVYSVPASTATLVTVATGGVGPDLVVWASTLLTTPLMERFVDLMGAHIREKVQKRWSDSHGATLAEGAEKAYFGPLADGLTARLQQARAARATLDDARLQLDRARSAQEQR